VCIKNLEDWGDDFLTWPLKYREAGSGLYYNYQTFKINASLSNDKGDKIATASESLMTTLRFRTDVKPENAYSYPSRYYYWGSYYIDRAEFVINEKSDSLVFYNVPASAITDSLTVKILSVKGINAETAGKTGYIKISAGNTE
jgi:hypothetical protein